MSELHRFRPTRAGIVNLYEYVDQVFTFAGGRLLLRGHNTSGKTKALELLLPFVLDGNIAPHGLDPFAQSARRVGDDLLLVRDGREPLSRGDLVAAIGDDGEVLNRQADYRVRLREQLLGLAGEEQHQTMLRLMRELHRPHLSKTLEPAGVAELLSAGLPEIDEGLMRRLAAGLEQLESLEAQLARLRGVRDKVRLFHERTYRAYLRSELRERAASLRRADSDLGRAADGTREAAPTARGRAAAPGSAPRRSTRSSPTPRCRRRAGASRRRARRQSADRHAVASNLLGREQHECCSDAALCAHGVRTSMSGRIERRITAGCLLSRGVRCPRSTGTQTRRSAAWPIRRSIPRSTGMLRRPRPLPRRSSPTWSPSTGRRRRTTR